jgi:hypothetical protein
MLRIENCITYGWEAVKGYEKYYLISPTGSVYSIRRKKVISPFVSSGYLQVELNVNGIAAKHLVHRLVAEAYLPNPSDFPCVNHKDGNKLNNSVDNLEWCTYKKNMEHAREHGLLKTIGSNNPASKLTEEDVKYIKSVYKKGDLEYGSSALGKKFGVDHKAIWSIVNGVTWRTVQC